MSKTRKPVDLFKHAPLEVQRLNKQAQSERRLKQRREWKRRNMDHDTNLGTN